MVFRIENQASGICLGLVEAESPEESILILLDEACCDDEPSNDLIASEVSYAECNLCGGAPCTS